MKLLIVVCCAFVILISIFGDIEGKRGGGGGGGRGGGKSGNSGRRSSWWTSNSKSSKTKAEASPKQPVHTPELKPSAPHPESAIKKQTAGVQQSSNAHPPAPGWNVPGSANQNTGWKSSYQSPVGSPPHQTHLSPPGQQPHGAWPAAGQGYNPYPQPHGYPGYAHNPGGYAGYPQQGYNPHYGGMGGYGGYGGNGGMGGYGGMPHGAGGFGMGGYGGQDMYRKKSFFSASTIGSVMTGMLLYHATSSLVGNLFGGSSYKKPVNVYNYYNQPETKEEIKLPSNILTLCEGNATALCTSGTTAICTTNSTVLCVATMTQATPCTEENAALCINTMVPCLDPNNPLCQNITTEKKEAAVNLPCFTNLTVDVNLLNETGGTQKDYKYCVTTMAVAGPEYKACDQLDKVNDFRSVLEGNYLWNLTIQPYRKPYKIHNFIHPTEASSGEIVMPVDILMPCVENATKLCAPGVTPICTTFHEIMCLEPLSNTTYCEQYNTTCVQRKIPCLENDPLCQNKTEEELIVEEDKTLVNVDFPCFANITVNANWPSFDIATFNGTFPEGVTASFGYHYRYCVITLGIPGSEADMCITGSPPISN